MSKKCLVIDPTKPLPSKLDTEYWETFAKLILERFCPNTFFSLSVDGDKPDLRNVSSGVGIEVTSSESKESREIDSLYAQQYIHGSCEQKKKALKRIEELGGKVKEHFLMHPTMNRSLERIYDVVEDKTKKLNNNYEIFNENDLFIFDSILIVDQELLEILNHITESSVGDVSFEKVFLCCLGGDLYEFNILSGTYKHYENSHKRIQQLALDARQVLVEKYK